jgi:hypothetical protein
VLDQLHSALARLNFENPETTDVRATVLVAQAASHADFFAMLLKVLEVCGLVGLTHRDHFGTFLKDDDKAH